MTSLKSMLATNPLHENHRTISLKKKAERKRQTYFWLYFPTSQVENSKPSGTSWSRRKSRMLSRAKSLDRLQPHLSTNVATKAEHGWSKRQHEQVKQRYGSVISAGPKDTLGYVKGLVKKHFHEALYFFMEYNCFSANSSNNATFLFEGRRTFIV